MTTAERNNLKKPSILSLVLLISCSIPKCDVYGNEPFLDIGHTLYHATEEALTYGCQSLFLVDLKIYQPNSIVELEKRCDRCVFYWFNGRSEDLPPNPKDRNKLILNSQEFVDESSTFFFAPSGIIHHKPAKDDPVGVDLYGLSEGEINKNRELMASFPVFVQAFKANRKFSDDPEELICEFRMSKYLLNNNDPVRYQEKLTLDSIGNLSNSVFILFTEDSDELRVLANVTSQILCKSPIPRHQGDMF